MILAEDIDSDAEALVVAERVLHALEEPFVVGSADVSMLASVGVSVSRDPDADPETMLREADVAMYRAKAAGGRGLELFDERLRREVRAQVELEGRLRHALPRRELVLAYQPIMPLGGGPPVGCRGARPLASADGEGRRAELRAAARVPPARPGERADRADRRMGAARRLRTGRGVARAPASGSPISVNVSARELTELDLAERVREELAYSGLPGGALCIEVERGGDPARPRSRT